MYIYNKYSFKICVYKHYLHALLYVELISASIDYVLEIKLPYLTLSYYGASGVIFTVCCCCLF